MSNYISNLSLSDSQEPAAAVPSAAQGPLVLTSISQTRPLDRGLSGLLFYRKSLKVLRKMHAGTSKNQKSSRWEIRLAEFEADVEPPKRGEISSFSIKSKSRLQHHCLNSSADYISQMTLTYDGDRCVLNGRAAKKDLNTWLTKVRRKYPGVAYLWVLEFQKNRNPHFHVFLTIPYSADDARVLGAMWNQTVKGTEKHLKVHQYVPNHRYKRPVKKGEKHGAFCPWEMGDGSYLTYKYLSKDKQKRVPPNFNDVGRFWGATRGLVKPVKALFDEEFYALFVDTLNVLTGELTTAQEHINRFFRDLRNFHEKRTNRARITDYHRQCEQSEGRWHVQKPKRFKSPIRRCCDATINKGRQFYEQWFEAYQRSMDIPF